MSADKNENDLRELEVGSDQEFVFVIGDPQGGYRISLTSPEGASLLLPADQSAELGEFLAAKKINQLQASVADLLEQLEEAEALSSEHTALAFTVADASGQYFVFKGYETGRIKSVRPVKGDLYLAIVNNQPKVGVATGFEEDSCYLLRPVKTIVDDQYGELREIGAYRAPMLGDIYQQDEKYIRCLPGDPERGRQVIFEQVDPSLIDRRLVATSVANFKASQLNKAIIYGDPEHMRGPRELAVAALKQLEGGQAKLAEELVLAAEDAVETGDTERLACALKEFHLADFS